jgi:MFS transporter, ACS family, hexuronate transporter
MKTSSHFVAGAPISPPRWDAAKWTICGLLFLATTNNYMDRQIIGLLAPTLHQDLHWTELEYGYVILAFQTAYAVGQVFVGGILDRIGTKRAFSWLVSGWSAAAIGHAFVSSAFGFGIGRFFLGLFEAGNYPAALKTVAEWFPKQQRALATGLFNAGSNVGAVLTPLLIPWIVIHFGWRAAFFVTGTIGFVFVPIWWIFYPKSTKSVAEIESPSQGRVRWVTFLQIARTRQGWAYASAKFLIDPIWWFYLFWLPKFLNSHFGLTIDKLGLPLVVVYLSADIGCVGFGWLSGYFLERGWSVNRARKVTLLICALLVLPVILTPFSSNYWAAILLVSLAVAALQGFGANLFTLATDLFPETLVGSAMGFGGTFGAIGGMGIATLAGFILQMTGSYISLFVIAGSVGLLALLSIHLLSPRLVPVETGVAPGKSF